MKRKPTPDAEPVTTDTLVPGALLARAQKLEVGKKPSHCVVCNEECAPNSVEGLCWVCRRLKLSAWRDSDTQMPAQE